VKMGVEDWFRHDGSATCDLLSRLRDFASPLT
jgi:hypothetical protein